VLNEAEPLLKQEGIALRRVVRPWDAIVWPHASKGFFALKKKIPTLLDALIPEGDKQADRHAAPFQLALGFNRALLKGVPQTNHLSTEESSPATNPSESTESEQGNWRNLMQPVREAAQEMAENGIIDITQKGRPVDPQQFKGPIRLRKKQP